jgi:MoaA/NifB/PqqE/SkfB family radical SAM enzyme
MKTLIAPFLHLSTLWVQVTGTWCNLQCSHCLNTSGPKHPWLKSLESDAVKRVIKEAEQLGVKEIYFTGGEPFLHRDILELVAFSLGVAATTVLTNGTLIDESIAEALASLAAEARYSLEIRISVDEVDPERNDRIRGKGALAREMLREGLPAEFIETIRTGWWTTCMEILPARERARGKYGPLQANRRCA